MAPSVTAPSIGIFDSGVGGLSIFHTIRARLPGTRLYYLSDNLYFPYGMRTEDEVVSCTLRATTRFIDKCSLDVLVIACNTASTVALPHLRSTFKVPVVGVVPAIKPAAALSQTGTIALLATPGTVKRPYTDELIQSFASQCRVIKTASTALVELAETKLRGGIVDQSRIAADVRRLFAESPVDKQTRLDVVVLGCTHFPLLKPELELAAPWPVAWIDSSDAIAARVDYLLTERAIDGKTALGGGAETAYFTLVDASVGMLEAALNGIGFKSVEAL